MSRPRVALLVDTATTWGAGIIEGVAEYAHEHTDWQLILGPHGKYERTLLPDAWNGSGVIARITHQQLADQILDLQLPAVDVSWFRFGENRIPRCSCDERVIAKVAADYFIRRGFRRYAYCRSTIRPNYVDILGEAFVRILQTHNLVCHVFNADFKSSSTFPRVVEMERLATWLDELPKPIALLAFDCLQARQVTDACEDRGIRVPQDVAVLGGEHDLLSCIVSRPQLSSIDHAPVEVGRRAALLLHRMINGEPAPKEPVYVEVTRIIERQSTNVLAIEDELLAAAVQFIRDHCHERIQVSDILRAVPLSRRSIEKSFRLHFGRSPAAEIRRARVERAIPLLCETSRSIPEIATEVGFERNEVLTRAFRRELETTPSEFRRQHLRDCRRRELRASTKR